LYGDPEDEQMLMILRKQPLVGWWETASQVLRYLKQIAASAKTLNVSFTILYISQLSNLAESPL
jgi:hypothetical protein